MKWQEIEQYIVVCRALKSIAMSFSIPQRVVGLHFLSLASGASPPSRTAGAIFRDIYISIRQCILAPRLPPRYAQT